MFTVIFGELLQKRHITSYKIAKETGIPKSIVYEWTAGIRAPTIDNLIKIADYFNVSTDYLLGRTDNPEINK
jgi:transcriptional regulator with XRE-family HTH domain